MYTCAQRASIAAQTVQSCPISPQAITSSEEEGNAGLIKGEGEALEGGHANAHACKRAGAIGHGESIDPIEREIGTL